MTDALAGIGRRMAKGAAWTIGTRAGVKVIGLVSTVILARLLVPEDFGLVALAMLLVGALQMTSEFSFKVFLIWDQEAGRREYDTVWTLKVLRGAVIGLVLILVAAPMAGFFDEPRVETIVYVFAVVAMVEGFSNVGIVDFQKDLRFHKEFQLEVSTKLTGFMVTIPLAIMWREYWALVAGMVAGRLMHIALSYAMHPYRPGFTLAAWRGVLGFSKWLVANNILKLLRKRTDIFLLGKFVGAGGVGLYTMAFQIANLASSELVAPIRRVIFPGYVKLAGDPDALRRSYLDSLSLILLVLAPITLGMGLVADPLVRVLLGENWILAIPLLQIFVIYGFAEGITSPVRAVYLALGRPSILTYVTLSALVILLPLVFLGVQHAGTVGAAWAVAITAVWTFFVHFTIASRLLDLTLRDLAAATWRTVAACGAMAVVVVSVQTLSTVEPAAPLFDHALLLFVCVSLGALVYTGVHFLLWKIAGFPLGAEDHIVNLLRQKIMRRGFGATT